MPISSNASSLDKKRTFKVVNKVLTPSGSTAIKTTLKISAKLPTTVPNVLSSNNYDASSVTLQTKPDGTVSIYRTDKEKKIDRLNLDRCSLNKIPIVVEDHTQLRLFSLQHNAITDLSINQQFPALVFLDVYDNEIENIGALDLLEQLRVLLIGKNRIRKITGLERLEKLEVLDLHGNQITGVAGLNMLGKLKVLNLGGNKIGVIGEGDFKGLASLNELNLRRNGLKKLAGFEEIGTLQKLYLSNNDIKKIDDMITVIKCGNLKELSMENNPVSITSDCISFLVAQLQFLTLVNGIQVTENFRKTALVWKRNKLQSLKTSPLNAGREKVISNAKTNWELLRTQTKSLSAKPSELCAFPKRNLTKLTAKHPQTRPNSLPRSNSTESSSLSSEFFCFPPLVIANRRRAKSSGAVNNNNVATQQQRGNTATASLSSNDPNVDSSVGSLSDGQLSKVTEKPRRRRKRHSKQSQLSCRRVDSNDSNDSDSSSDSSRGTSLSSNSSRDVTCDVTSDVNRDVTCDVTSDVTRDVTRDLATSDVATILPNHGDGDKDLGCLSIGGSSSGILPRGSSADVATSDLATSSTVVTSSASELSATGSGGGVRRTMTSRRGVKSAFMSTVTRATTASHNNRSSLSRHLPHSRATSVRLSKSQSHSQSPSTVSGGEATTSSSSKTSTAVATTAAVVPSVASSNMAALVAASSSSSGVTTSSQRDREQGGDYLVEICGRHLNVYGHGALRHLDRPWSVPKAADVTTVNFHYANYNGIAAVLSRLKHRFPHLSHLTFTGTCLSTLGQLNALSEVQGLRSIHVHEEGNPLFAHPRWRSYAIYRLSHWGLKIINNNEITEIEEQEANTEFQSLSDLVLYTLPDRVLEPLLVHLKLDFDELSTDGANSTFSKRNLLLAEPALRGVITKEALQWRKNLNSQDEFSVRQKSRIHVGHVLNEMVNSQKKLIELEKVWPTVLRDIVQNSLLDYTQFDSYKKAKLQQISN